MTETVQRIPALINSKSGTADAAREAMSAHDGFDVTEVQPDGLEAALKEAVSGSASRILVAGGDGTIATAAGALVDGPTELALLPGGTLNHFATDLGIPTEPAEALDLALNGTARPADVAEVNGRVFLNTASAGAYVHFVKVREYLEPRFGYRIASAIAALRVMFQIRLLAVEVDVKGETRIYRTPIVFIGVGERELQLPSLGKRVPNGQPGLHVMIVRGRSRARLLAVALNAVARGVKTAARTPEMDAFVVDRCTITMRRSSIIALDGELVSLGQELKFKMKRGALRVVCP
jgi:diacylglycerol kinase family enzyme